MSEECSMSQIQFPKSQINVVSEKKLRTRSGMKGRKTRKRIYFEGEL